MSEVFLWSAVDVGVGKGEREVKAKAKDFSQSVFEC